MSVKKSKQHRGQDSVYPKYNLFILAKTIGMAYCNTGSGNTSKAIRDQNKPDSYTPRQTVLRNKIGIASTEELEFIIDVLSETVGSSL